MLKKIHHILRYDELSLILVVFMSPILYVVGGNVCKRHMKARDLEDRGQMVAVSNGSQPNLFPVAKSINLDQRVNIIDFYKIEVKLWPYISVFDPEPFVAYHILPALSIPTPTTRFM